MKFAEILIAFDVLAFFRIEIRENLIEKAGL